MINLNAIGYVENTILNLTNENWNSVTSKIKLNDEILDNSLIGLEKFSHIEIIFYFNKVNDLKICFDTRHPRNNKDWPKVGIFSQRGKDRQNKISVTICKLISVQSRELIVNGLDAINRTLVIDINYYSKIIGGESNVSILILKL